MLTAPLLLALLGVRAPERLTAGPADQFLGALGPDGAALYFVSDEQSTTQIYVQDMARGIPRLLFDEVADTSWPRPSPDGKHLLYISYQTDAAGDVCVRDLPGGERRCLTDASSAEALAVWMPDGKAIAVVTRTGLHGDFELRRLPLGGGKGEPLVHGNLSSPALSPDGKWVAYVPVERGSEQVGPSFLAKAGGAIEIAPLTVPGGGKPQRAEVDLPGASGFPAFSVDGKWLYFTQFLNDTNLDGAVDGNDNAVLFRAPFDGGKLGKAQQLTSARLSCQYPVPARDRVIATCLDHGSLDVFSLPLDGAVPADWNAERLDDELSASTDRWEKLLLLSRRGGDPSVLLTDVVRLHLELGEYESAAFYARRLAKSDPAVGAVLGELAAHRKSERALSRGSISGAFVADARKRLIRLDAVPHPLARLARSEIYDTLGEEREARVMLTGVDTKDPLVASLYAERLLALYRDDSATLLDLYRPLAERDLGHAEVYVRELERGASGDERKARATAALARVQPDSELAFLLELELALADLDAATQDQVRERVFQIYRKNKEMARRKTLVATTTARAVADDNEFLLYNFANTWVSYVPKAKAERRHAEALYRDAVLERAYVAESRGNPGEARSQFFGITLQTESLEAHAGFMEMRLAEGKDPLADYAAQKDRTSPVVAHFARAYLAARALPREKDLVKHEAAAQGAIKELMLIAEVAPQRAEVHELWGYIAQQRWLRRGERLAAVEANAHYLLALDLARESPRHRAAILDALGRLQMSVGNHAIARGWLEERGKLPFPDELSRFSHCLAYARARFHLGEESAAAAAVDGCETPASDQRYHALVLDRSALYHLSGGEPALAAERYAALWPLVEGAAGPEGARNRLTTQTGWAAATLAAGKPAEALEHVAAAEELLAAGAAVPLEGPYGRLRPVMGATPGDPGLLLLGLRAQAHFQNHQLPEATAAMTRRRDALARRLSKDELDEDRLELASSEAQLALYARQQRKDGEALVHIEAALRHWDAWSTSTGTPLEDTGLAILCGYAELFLFAGLPPERMAADLPARLESSYNQLSQVRNPAWETARDRLEVYLTLLHLRRP